MWGQYWGEMIWGGVQVPLLSPIGFAALIAAFLAGGLALRNQGAARRFAWLGATALALGPLAVFAVALPHTFVNGTIADADEVNENLLALADALLLTFDSGFIPVAQNQDIVLVHDLGTTAVVGSIWFSKDGSGTDLFYGPAPLSWREHNLQYTSGVTIAAMTEETVTLRTGNDFRIPSPSPGADAYETVISGYARVVLISLPAR
jgi:hypothetical protein